MQMCLDFSLPLTCAKRKRTIDINKLQDWQLGAILCLELCISVNKRFTSGKDLRLQLRPLPFTEVNVVNYRCTISIEILLLRKVDLCFHLWSIFHTKEILLGLLIRCFFHWIFYQERDNFFQLSHDLGKSVKLSRFNKRQKKTNARSLRTIYF